MEHRRTVRRVRPPQPEIEELHLEVTYTCDACGTPMLQWNHARDGDGGKQARSQVQALLDREHMSGDGDGAQRISRDYCDECLPAKWQAIEKILALP